MSSGRPRSASLPPSSITTMGGLCCASSAGRRERPPDVVSPLMLALITLAAILSRAICFSSSATQPVPRARPYSADRLSPTTSRRPGCRCRGRLRGPAKPPPAPRQQQRLQCREQPGAFGQ
jgi:hypothetical protein